MSLCYQPNTSQVSIIVLKAMGLPELEGGSHPGMSAHFDFQFVF